MDCITFSTTLSVTHANTGKTLRSKRRDNSLTSAVQVSSWGEQTPLSVFAVFFTCILMCSLSLVLGNKYVDLFWYHFWGMRIQHISLYFTSVIVHIIQYIFQHLHFLDPHHCCHAHPLEVRCYRRFSLFAPRNSFRVRSNAQVFGAKVQKASFQLP